MKNFLFTLILCGYSALYAQISVSSDYEGSFVEVRSESFEKFKSTTTVFVLSEVYSTEEYEKILKESWTITPFQIVKMEDLNLNKFDLNTTSFAVLTGQINTVVDPNLNGKTRYDYLLYVDFFLYKAALKERELENYAKMSDTRRSRYNILTRYKEDFARFYLMPSKETLNDLENDNTHRFDIYKEPVFCNFTLGSLKNYFQFINGCFVKNQSYWLKQNSSLPEISELKSSKLYIPSYILTYLKMDEPKMTTDELLEEYFGNYQYEYEVTEEDNLSTKILNNEKLYYLRYFNLNNELYLQIISSLTGAIIYTSYDSSKNMKLKDKNIEAIGNTIHTVLE